MFVSKVFHFYYIVPDFFVLMILIWCDGGPCVSPYFRWVVLFGKRNFCSTGTPLFS